MYKLYKNNKHIKTGSYRILLDILKKEIDEKTIIDWDGIENVYAEVLLEDGTTFILAQKGVKVGET